MLAEDETLDGAAEFYRPPAKRPERSQETDIPFRDNRRRAPFSEDEDEPFLRSNRRVAVRRGLIPRTRWGRAGLAAGGMVLISGAVWLGIAVRDFAAHDPRFRIESSDNIQIAGNSELTKVELLGVFGADMGRNIFFVPLKERRDGLERLPWVEQATVMRLLPDQLRVAIVERMPVAFVRSGNNIGLVDHDGVLLPMDAKTLAAKHYSFPVVTGISAEEPQPARAARMKLYLRFIAELDSGGERISSQLSEVDLSDLEDVRVLVPSEGSDLLLHLGDQDFLPRWRNYQQHLTEWKSQYPHLASIDLRYERQVVLEMQKGGPAAPGNDVAGIPADGAKKIVGSSTTAPPLKGTLAKRKAAIKKMAAVAKTHPGMN